jgi:hypothetical protein
VLAKGWELECPTRWHFGDVPPGSAFYCYIETAYAHGIISGYASNVFLPYNPVSRGQLSKIVVLAQEWPLYNPPTPTFNDVPPDHPFYAYIETAHLHNIISGYADGSFSPGGSATRGQICKIVYLAITQ